MNIFFNLKQDIEQILQDISQKNIEYKFFTIEPSKNSNHGDLATNVAMVLSKDFGMNPRELAKLIITKIESNPKILKAEIAGPGFINITLKNKIWHEFLLNLFLSKEITLPKLGDEKTLINIEYASPNPTGPMHIGHSRGAIYGDVLANLLEKTGHKIIREYYINDAGNQIDILVESAYMRYLQDLGENIKIPENLYPGHYLISVGKTLKTKFGENLKSLNKTEYIPKIRNLVVDEMLKIIISDLDALGIKHDVLFSEKKNLHDTNKINEALQILEDKNLIYEGIIDAPKDTTKTEKSVNLREKQTLFRSSDFGDDSDRVVKKPDGTPTYLAGDIAYLKSKFERGAKKMILPLGFDHAGYVKRLSAACMAITNNQAEVKVILCQMVKFVKNGEQLKMSKRAGNFITLRDVLDEVGADALRFTMLTRKNDAPFDFDLAKVIEQSKDNPVFYVQYAHARCSSVLRNLKSEMPHLNIDDIKINILENLSNELEIELIRKLANYSRIIAMAVSNYEPHRIAFYLQELASLFHSLWNKGTDNPQLKFIIKDNDNVTKARICLIIVTKKVIASALSIFNIKAVEEMK